VITDAFASLRARRRDAKLDTGPVHLPRDGPTIACFDPGRRAPLPRTYSGKELSKVNASTVPSGLRGVAFVGNHLPRPCGIATFTTDLADAVEHRLGPGADVNIVAINDLPQGYSYPRRVTFEIRQNQTADYRLAAEYLNESNVDVVCLQHEFGIFGGDGGENILLLLGRLRKPVVVTCHTVAEQPDPDEERVLNRIVQMATKVVVMSRQSSSVLTTRYNADHEKVDLIPHGVHPFPFVETASHKGSLGLCGRKVLLTFGLLHRQKGIEHMLEAMPAVLERHPDSMYLILGATHPVVRREEGESYRESLTAQVERLGLSGHVRFHPEFVPLPRLLDFIGAADVCVMPYTSLDQAASGVLAYTLAMGRAVISTPTRYAGELLAEGRGRLVPPADPAALADEVIGLLADERRTMMMRRRAYSYGRMMSWPVVGGLYVRLFEELAGLRAVGADRTRPIAARTITESGTHLST
jgi:glycosyltransferase involved in cell wall biosynthesis